MHLAGGIFFYGAGLLLAPYLYDSDFFRIIPFILGAFVVIGRRKRFSPALIALFLVSLGLNQYVISNSSNPNDLSLINATAGEPARIEGIVRSVNSRPGEAVSIDLESVRMESADGFKPLQGCVRIYSNRHEQKLLPDDTVRVLARLKEPRNFMTPGAFDYKRYLLRRGIVATGYTGSTANFARLHTTRRWSPVRSIKNWRTGIREMISRTLPERTAPYINALAIGDRGAMSVAQRSLLAETGLAHLFAISGLHLGLVASFLYFLLRLFYLKTFAANITVPARRLIPPLIIPLLAGYMLLTGMAISTMRALIMLGAATLLCTLSRRTRPADILLAAIFAILAFDPLAIFEPSFQLSVAGAGGIIFSLPLWQPYLQRRPAILRAPLTLLAATLAATIATLPFVLLHFHTFAPAGLLLNLLAVPLVSMVLLPLILVGVVLSLVNDSAASFLFKLAAAILEPFLQLVKNALSIDLLSARAIYLTPLALLALSLAVAALFAINHLSLRNKIVAIATVTLLALSPVLSADSRGRLNIVAIDVGQGDAMLLQTPHGGNFLVDGGGLYSKRFDTGERLVAPALGHLGVRTLDAVILSHDHPDHRKGLVYILETFRVESFWSPVPARKLHYTLKKVLADRQIPVRTFSSGWQPIDAAETLQIFRPANNSRRRNDHSLVLYARNDADGVLLTGDLESMGIRELVKAAAPGPVSLLKLPHHGSRKSDPLPLLEKFRPRHAFTSVGYNNRYNLPHRKIVATLANASVPLKRTDRDGTTLFSSAGRGWAITHWKKGLFR